MDCSSCSRRSERFNRRSARQVKRCISWHAVGGLALLWMTSVIPGEEGGEKGRGGTALFQSPFPWMEVLILCDAAGRGQPTHTGKHRRPSPLSTSGRKKLTSKVSDSSLSASEVSQSKPLARSSDQSEMPTSRTSDVTARHISPATLPKRKTVGITLKATVLTHKIVETERDRKEQGENIRWGEQSWSGIPEGAETLYQLLKKCGVEWQDDANDNGSAKGASISNLKVTGIPRNWAVVNEFGNRLLFSKPFPEQESGKTSDSGFGFFLEGFVRLVVASLVSGARIYEASDESKKMFKMNEMGHNEVPLHSFSEESISFQLELGFLRPTVAGETIFGSAFYLSKQTEELAERLVNAIKKSRTSAKAAVTTPPWTRRPSKELGDYKSPASGKKMKAPTKSLYGSKSSPSPSSFLRRSEGGRFATAGRRIGEKSVGLTQHSRPFRKSCGTGREKLCRLQIRSASDFWKLICLLGTSVEGRDGEGSMCSADWLDEELRGHLSSHIARQSSYQGAKLFGGSASPLFEVIVYQDGTAAVIPGATLELLKWKLIIQQRGMQEKEMLKQLFEELPPNASEDMGDMVFVPQQADWEKHCELVGFETMARNPDKETADKSAAFQTD